MNLDMQTASNKSLSGIFLQCKLRALTPLFGNGAGAHGIGEISCVLTKIGKFDGSSAIFWNQAYMFLKTNIMLYNEY